MSRLTRRDQLRLFRSDQGGNIAVIFGIALAPLIGLVGAAVDYSRASNARSAMQTAVDAAALMISKDLSSGTITSSQISAKAQTYFDSLYTNTAAPNVAITSNYTARDSSGTSTIQLSAAGSMATAFLQTAGFPSIGLNTSSTTSWGGTRMRVAIALDVTGSMAYDGKMDAMKTAAKSLIDTLSKMAATNDDVYVSIVPFAQFVNVSTSNKNADWIKWTEFGSCSSIQSNSMDAYVSRFASKSSCQANNGTWTASSNKSAWKGCVIDRDQSYDVSRDAPTNNSTDFPAAYSTQNGKDVCPASILAMTSVYSSANVTVVKNKIDDLDPAGGTNQAIGMAWAWQTLLDGDPLSPPPKDANYKYSDAIILLSDGLNTIDRWYGNGSDPSSQVDDRQKLLCDNIKKAAANYTVPKIFTIQVNTDNDPEAAALKYCADVGRFYPTSTASGIAPALKAIGTALSALRISK